MIAEKAKAPKRVKPVAPDLWLWEEWHRFGVEVAGIARQIHWRDALAEIAKLSDEAYARKEYGAWSGTGRAQTAAQLAEVALVQGGGAT